MKPLTNREIDVLRLYARGNTSKEIAESLNISFHTVESHKKNMLHKCDAKNIVELAVLAVQKDWV